MVKTRIFDSEFGNLKIHFRAFAAADPVSLHFLERIAPVNRIEIGQQFFGVGGDAEHPLAHGLADDGKAADFAFAINDFLIGQNGAEFGTPVHRRFADKGQALGIDVSAACGLIVAIRRDLQRLDRFSPVGFRIEPGIVQLEENPLGPFEIIGVGRGQFAGPVVAEAEAFDLAGEGGDVGLGGDARMLAGFDGVLFRRQTEGIPAHRMQHVEAAGPAVARQDVRGGVAFRMTDMQARAAGIRKHVEDVILWRQLRGGHFARNLMAQAEGMAVRHKVVRVEGAESLLCVPDLLPFGLDQMKRI